MPPSSTNHPEEKPTVVFVAFESEYAAFGGLGAVMGLLPKEMAASEDGLPSFVLAPYFKNIGDLKALKAKKKLERYKKRLSFPLTIQDKTYTVEVIEVVGDTGLKTYLLGAEGFFTAPANPYINPQDASLPLDPYTNPNVAEKLTEDALFFSTAAPIALVELRKAQAFSAQDLILHLQDWETACVAQALTLVPIVPELASIRCVLTLHNPYDRYLSPAASPLVTDLVTHLGLAYDNVLAQMIPLVGETLSTVSQNFAQELTSDPLHTHTFAPHLQGVLAKKKLVGIDNGLFGTLAFPFSKKAQRDAEKGKYETIQREKWERRKNLGDVLDAYQRELADNE
ncbi:MAG: glycogen/starch synthase, partial [Bacteroidetes bacterium]|nr:glycogen/starch synthase [Bacteroidota bacterium]